MEKISKLKSNDDDPSAKDEIRELQIQISLEFIELKKLNRMEKFRTKYARDLLSNAKSGVDSRHLQLQNLLYEVMHSKKEVIKCLQFKSKDELIELVSEDEFYNEAPESISRPSITKNNDHQLRLARLEWELTQRKQLSLLCDELTESKKGVGLNIELKQFRLDNLAPQLRTILDASKPLQDSLGIGIDKIHDEHKKASLLPVSLYVLYSKTTAYRDAYDIELNVNVNGDEDEAKRINNQDGIQDSDSDSDNPTLESAIDETIVHKKRHHRISKEARIEEKKMKILQRHPLSVDIIIYIKNDIKLTLRFYYMMLLKIITVESHLETVINKINDTDDINNTNNILSSESILRSLYDNDMGIESPNPANNYHLSKYNFGKFTTLGIGMPYKWAQNMAGLNFITQNIKNYNNKITTANKLAHYSVENVIKEIKKRIKSRIELYNEIRQLEKGNFINSTVQLMPQKITTYLYKFTSLKDHVIDDNADDDDDNNEESSVNMHYEAVLRHGNNEMIARITIKPDYPKVIPVFKLKINSEVSGGVDDVIRDIEREVNVMWDTTDTTSTTTPPTPPTTISSQIQRLCACFDIYLETENIVTREKIFFHPVKGRSRARPYKYLSIGGGIFTQR